VKSSIALAALVAASLGLGAILPAAAQDAAPSPPPAAAATPDQTMADPDQGLLDLFLPDSGTSDARFMMPGPGGMGRGGMGRGGGILALACSPKGAEALDVLLVHLQYRLDLTDTQKPLFDAFRTKALTTETSFADTCKSSLPDRSADAKPDMLSRLKAGLAVDQAKLTALNDVLPDFEALYDTLTDQQKAALAPHHMGGGGMNRMDRGGQDDGRS
jgi:hypothetical protein